MTCRELDDFLLDYVGGDLPEDVRREFDSHLRVCPACVDYVQTYRVSIRIGKAAFAGDGEVPAEVPEELVRAILAARRGGDSTQRTP